ncbi:MAG: hypothetical protein ACC707_09770 [Thiohalomonadales bacterium]
MSAENVYDVDKLMAEARKLAANYRKMTGKALGISSEIALHDVIRLMNLVAVPVQQGGFDAIGKGAIEGKRIQIKGRTVSPDSKQNQRIGQIKMDQEWDSVMLVVMNEDYEALEIYEAERESIMEAVGKSNAKRKNRGALTVTRFKHIAKAVWSQASGIIKE